jgi:hypothetical protein
MPGLPPRVKSILKEEMIAANTAHLTDAKANVASANNIVRHSAARMIDEASPQQARAIDKILRLPPKPAGMTLYDPTGKVIGTTTPPAA